MREFNLVHSVTICMSYIAFFAASVAAALYLIQDSAIKNKLSGAIFNRLPSLSFLDMFNYRSIGLGFPILTISILSGFIWAKNIYGAYWQGYNPRHLYSLVLWLIYAVILHVRLSERLRGRKVALLSITAFFMMVLTLFGACR
jgi:ABC-type transport system involved in cytochrome c biogenesis permease subunit